MHDFIVHAKRLDNGEWVEGNLFVPDKPDTPTQICIGTNIVRITYDVDPSTIGWYTGLKDKNGKRIFEGDIFSRLDGAMDGIPRIVRWDEEHMEFKCPLVKKHWAFGKSNCSLWLMKYEDIEVIGNIHDNPELLK